MFKKLILGYSHSPSLGDELLKYEKYLRKKIKWGVFSCFLIIIFIITVVASQNISESLYRNSNTIPLQNTESTNDLSKSVRISSVKSDIKNNEEITFTLSIKNNSSLPIADNFRFQASDILEYADITDKNITITDGYGQFKETIIQPGETVEKIISAKIKRQVPLYRQNPKIKNSYDCTISTFFGNIVDYKIACPFFKNIEFLNNSFENIDIKNVVFFSTIIFIWSILSILRTNLLLNHIVLIRRGEHE